MKMLKKFFLPAILFGTLLVSTSIGFVSCSDDYDDTALKAADAKLTTTTTSLQTQLTTLTTAQASLPKMSDVTAAAASAATTAADDAEASAIDSAYIADAAQLIVINQNIEDAKTALQTAIDAVQASSETKLDADQVADAITAAIADNNSDYVTTAIAAAVSNLQDAITTAVADLQDADEVSAAITTAIADLQDADEVSAAIATAVADLQDEDQVNALITAAITANDVVDANDLSNAITAATDPIYAKLTDLGYYTKSILNTLTIAKTDNTWYYGDPVAANVTFGPNDEITYSKDEEINNLSLDIIANISPSTVDMTLYNFGIYNSQKEELPVINLGTPVAYTGLLTKANNSTNNYWKFPTTMDWSEVSTPGDLYSKLVYGSEQVVFGLYAISEDGRQTRSTNDITFTRTKVTAPTLTLSVDPATSGFNSDVVFTLKNGGTPIIGSTTPVYKKYITLTDPTTYDAANFTGLDQLMDNDDTIKVQCTNEDYKDKSINFTVHYLNYDGTVGSLSIDVMFAKLVYKDVTIDLNSTIDFGKLITAQTSDMTSIADFSTEVGVISDYITDNDISSVAIESSDINGTVTALPYDATNPATLYFYKADGTSMIATESVGNTISPVNSAFTDNLSNIKLVYSANSNFVDAVGEYGVKLTFLNTTGNPVNYLYLVLNVAAPDDATMKTTTAWNTELTEANVWAEITGANAEYNMTNSYLVDPSSFEYNEPDPADNAMSFAGSTFSIPGYGIIADRTGNNYSVTSTYNTFAGGATSTDWVVTNTFDVHMRSAVNEATPEFATPVAANASLIYKNTADDSKEVLDITSILATDPSDISQKIEYAPSIAPIILDSRISTITYTIIDPDETTASSNAGLAQFEIGGTYSSSMTVTSTTTDPISIVSAFHANVTGAPAALGDDVTLNLQMEVTDIFGFTNTFKLPFTVKKNQN